MSSFSVSLHLEVSATHPPSFVSRGWFIWCICVACQQLAWSYRNVDVSLLLAIKSELKTFHLEPADVPVSDIRAGWLNAAYQLLLVQFVLDTKQLHHLDSHVMTGTNLSEEIRGRHLKENNLIKLIEEPYPQLQSQTTDLMKSIDKWQESKRLIIGYLEEKEM